MVRAPAHAIDLRLLRRFVAVAEELHFHRAARRLAILQPPLTAAIKRFEAEIGATLIERGNRIVPLTAAGTALLQEARTLLMRADRAVVVTRDAAAGRTGTVRLGYVGSAMYGRLPAAIRSVRRRHPAVKLELREATTTAQLIALRAGELDIAIVIPPFGSAAKLHLRPSTPTGWRLPCPPPTAWPVGVRCGYPSWPTNPSSCGR